MGSFLKLIGGFIAGGILMISMNRFMGSLNQTSHERILDCVTVSNSTHLSQLIEFDLNRLGMGVSRIEDAIIEAQAHSITFYSDVDENNVVDKVRYLLSETSAAGETENPNDKILYRILNDETPQAPAFGVTSFELRYFDWYGDETTDLSLIKTIEVSLELQSIAPYADHYSAFYWQHRASPPNLRRY